MPAKKGSRWRFSGLARMRIAPSCAIASVRIVGGSTGAPPPDRDKYRSFSDTFFRPTMRLSSSSSVTRSTNRKGERCGRICSIAAVSRGSVRSIGNHELYCGAGLYHRPHRRSMTTHANSFEQLTTLFALGREVASVLDLEELLQKIPQLIARLTKFNAFAVYLLDTTRDELLIAYAVGYPEDVARSLRVKVGQGLVGAAVAAGQPPVVSGVHAEPQYIETV